MNVAIWARVSSREQREGYSIDAHIRACRETRRKHGWNVLREFTSQNRLTRSPDHAYAGGLFQCEYCGSLITGEKIRRKLKHDGIRVHQYYRCANNERSADHPQVRWKEADLEQAIINDLSRLRITNAEQREWFHEALAAAFLNLTAHSIRQLGQ